MGGGDHPEIAIQQKEIAVTTHQFEHQTPFGRVPGAAGEDQFDAALPALVLDGNQRQALEAMLQLPRQGAAIALARRCPDRQQPRRLRQPAGLQPLHPIKVAQGQLQGVGVTLLGFLEAAGQKHLAQLGQDRPQGGGIHRLQAQGRARLGWTWSARAVLLLARLRLHLGFFAAAPLLCDPVPTPLR